MFWLKMLNLPTRPDSEKKLLQKLWYLTEMEQTFLLCSHVQ